MLESRQKADRELLRVQKLRFQNIEHLYPLKKLTPGIEVKYALDIYKDFELREKNETTKIYSSNKERLKLVAGGEVIYIVAYECMEENDDTSLNGIKCGDKSKDILEKFNNDIDIKCVISSDPEVNSIKQNVRFYQSSKYNIRYITLYDEVFSLFSTVIIDQPRIVDCNDKL